MQNARQGKRKFSVRIIGMEKGINEPDEKKDEKE